MPLNVPNLDDRTYADLVEEAFAMIPRYAPQWTNYNPSDPGVTLIELFAYFTEILIYRLNRVTRASKVAFLKLLREVSAPEEKHLLQAPATEVDEALREAVLGLGVPQRAVTREDYEYLARTVEMEGHAGAKAARVLCLMGTDLETPGRPPLGSGQPGHVSVVVLPDRELHGDPGKFPELIRNELDKRRLLTVRLHVTGPHYLFLSVGAEIHTVTGASVDEVRSAALGRLESHFDPFPGGGPDGEGWPFGSAVHLSEILELLEDVDGVAFIREIYVLNLATSEKRFFSEFSAVGVQVGIHSTVGVDTRLGCLTPADTERLVTDTSGRLMAVRLWPYELVKMDYAGLTFVPGAP